MYSETSFFVFVNTCINIVTSFKVTRNFSQKVYTHDDVNM